MTIKQIYDQLGMPPNLQEHMIWVAKVVLFIKNHWRTNNELVDWNKIITASLLHDVGNIVKFDFDKYPQFLGGEVGRIEYWKQKQKETVTKYGQDDHEATRRMLEEMKIPQDLIQVILGKSFGNSVAISKSQDWITKLLLYADCRVMPDGIHSMRERLDEVVARLGKYKDRADLPDLENACFDIEKQIQSNLLVTVSEITDKSVDTPYDFLATEV